MTMVSIHSSHEFERFSTLRLQMGNITRCSNDDEDDDKLLQAIVDEKINRKICSAAMGGQGELL